MSETGFVTLGDGLATIDAAITNVVVPDGITPEDHGLILRRVFRTIFQVNATAIPGSSFLAGAGAPAAGLGITGDHYVRLEDGDVFEKTDASTWTATGFSLQGLPGATGDPGGLGPAGANGASRDLRVDGTQLQTKLSTQPVGSYVDLYDLAELAPVFSLTSSLELQYRLSGNDPATLTTLYDFTNLLPQFRVSAAELQWKLAVQPLEDYVTVFDFEGVRPIFRDNAGVLEYRYADEVDADYQVIGPLASPSGLDGDQLVVDVALSHITPDVSVPEANDVKHLAAILKGVDNKLASGFLKMRYATLDATALTNRSYNFNVTLLDPANAQLSHNGSFINPAWFTVSGGGVLTWPEAGDFATALTAGDAVVLFSV